MPRRSCPPSALFSLTAAHAIAAAAFDPIEGRQGQTLSDCKRLNMKLFTLRSAPHLTCLLGPMLTVPAGTCALVQERLPALPTFCVKELS